MKTLTRINSFKRKIKKLKSKSCPGQPANEDYANNTYKM